MAWRILGSVVDLGGDPGPGEDGLDGFPVAADPGGLDGLGERVGSGCAEGIDRETERDEQADLTGEDIIEQIFISGHGGVQVLADLAAEPAGFDDEVATMADPDLKLLEHRRRGRVDQTEAMNGGVVDGLQVGVVGLVSGVGGLAELIGGQGIDDADLEAGVLEGLLDDPVIASGAFDDDDEIGDLVAPAACLTAVMAAWKSGARWARVVGGMRQRP